MGLACSPKGSVEQTYQISIFGKGCLITARNLCPISHLLSFLQLNVKQEINFCPLNCPHRWNKKYKLVPSINLFKILSQVIAYCSDTLCFCFCFHDFFLILAKDGSTSKVTQIHLLNKDEMMWAFLSILHVQQTLWSTTSSIPEEETVYIT